MYVALTAQQVVRVSALVTAATQSRQVASRVDTVASEVNISVNGTHQSGVRYRTHFLIHAVVVRIAPTEGIRFPSWFRGAWNMRRASRIHGRGLGSPFDSQKRGVEMMLGLF
jgi:hypothetical protein